jgi:hypothetical protein
MITHLEPLDNLLELPNGMNSNQCFQITQTTKDKSEKYSILGKQCDNVYLSMYVDAIIMCSMINKANDSRFTAIVDGIGPGGREGVEEE